MAKYDRKAARKIGQVMHEFKEGELRDGLSGQPVKSRKQAIAIGLAQAREQEAQGSGRKRPWA